MRERHPAEFLPLAFYPWISRPETLPIEYDEAATNGPPKWIKMTSVVPFPGSSNETLSVL